MKRAGRCHRRLINAPWMERYAHALAGLVIVLTAILVLLIGI